MKTIELFEQLLQYLKDTVLEDSKEEFSGIECESFVRDVILELLRQKIKGINILDKESYNALIRARTNNQMFTEQELNAYKNYLSTIYYVVSIMDQISKEHSEMIIYVLNPLK